MRTFDTDRSSIARYPFGTLASGLARSKRGPGLCQRCHRSATWRACGGAAGGALGEEGGPIAADNLDAGPLGEPDRRRVRFPVRQEVHRATCLDADEHSFVDMCLALGVLVHANHAGRGRWRVGQRGDQTQQGPADRRPEGVRHPGAGPALERKNHRDQSRSQPLGPSAEPAGEPGHLLGEGLARAGVLLADERRTRNDTAANLPTAGRSRGNCRYEPCIRPGQHPHPGQAAWRTATRPAAAVLRSRRSTVDHTAHRPGDFRADFSGRRRSVRA